jgi:hypothetical protein
MKMPAHLLLLPPPAFLQWWVRLFVHSQAMQTAATWIKEEEEELKNRPQGENFLRKAGI